jgi:hypothetical protein
MENKKLKQEEISKIQEIQNRLQSVKTELGQIALTEIELKNNRKNVEDYLVETRRMETELVRELEEKYGRGHIDLQKGEFSPAKTEDN